MEGIQRNCSTQSTSLPSFHHGFLSLSNYLTASNKNPGAPTGPRPLVKNDYHIHFSLSPAQHYRLCNLQLFWIIHKIVVLFFPNLMEPHSSIGQSQTSSAYLLERLQNKERWCEEGALLCSAISKLSLFWKDCSTPQSLLLLPNSSGLHSLPFDT